MYSPPFQAHSQQLLLGNSVIQNVVKIKFYIINNLLFERVTQQPLATGLPFTPCLCSARYLPEVKITQSVLSLAQVWFVQSRRCPCWCY